MRLLLLPISRNTSLLYCHRIAPPLPPGTSPPRLERIITYASNKWHEWERAESGWQKRVTESGNRLLKRVPHEEWGLKSVPARQSGPEGEVDEARVKVQWPRGLLGEEKAMSTLDLLGGEERRAFHRRWLWGSVLGMPVTAPMALVPIIPNLPFFYLVFRAWSHWRALGGAKHLSHLLSANLLDPQPSELLRHVYAYAMLSTSIQRLEDEILRRRENRPPPKEAGPEEDEMLLSKKSGKIIAEVLEIPALEEEVERAIWQVKRQLRGKKELKEEKKELDSALKHNQ